MFVSLKWWIEREKRLRKTRSPGSIGMVTSFMVVHASQGRSPASREQKRQKRARMITRRHP